MAKRPETRPILLTVGEREVDLRRAFPLTLDDWVILEDIGLVSESAVQNLGARTIRSLMIHLVRKCHPEATEDAIGAVPINALRAVVPAIMAQVKEDGDRPVDRPT